MAGMAISPLLKMKGEVAMAMAWAAFCIPTSITMVRLTASEKPPKRERRELQSIAPRIMHAAATPNTLKFSKILFSSVRN